MNGKDKTIGQELVDRLKRFVDKLETSDSLNPMPGIDYSQLREKIHISDVLQLAGFEAAETSGDQVRGPCPIHGSNSPTSRSFSANLGKNSFRCFKCGASGNQLDLWVALSKLPLHEAAKDLCERLGIETPEIRRW